MKNLRERLHELADGEISAFEGFLLLENFQNAKGKNINNSGIIDPEYADLMDEWAECWQDDAICIFRPNNDADESGNLIGFWDAGKILEKHCELNADLNAAYFLIDFDSFIAICDMQIIRDFAKENSISPIFSIIG